MTFSDYLKKSIYLKIFVIALIGVLLYIPKAMIQSLISERQTRQQEVYEEVSSKWGKEQTIIGPIIAIPYTTSIENSKQKWLFVLPTELSIKGNISTKKRHRGIYEVVVYTAKLSLEGTFKEWDFIKTDTLKTHYHLDKAVLFLGISDLRGIQNQVTIIWNDENFTFNPGLISGNGINSGIKTAIPIKINEDSSYKFSIELLVNGSKGLYFVPIGKTTDVILESQWQHPSFTGTFLPDSHTVTSSGFTAHWNILHLNRGFPQKWRGSSHMLPDWTFGVELLVPTDHYQKSLRAVKYAILVIGLTFLVFFFVEVLRKVFIHPMQYILVGIALIVFYTLLLSISEHINFNFAFIVSALATISLVTLYMKAILNSLKIALLISIFLTLIYVFIFTTIQLQDYALLFGSVGIFLILALVMFLSRKIDWDNVYDK